MTMTREQVIERMLVCLEQFENDEHTDDMKALYLKRATGYATIARALEFEAPVTVVENPNAEPNFEILADALGPLLAKLGYTDTAALEQVRQVLTSYRAKAGLRT